MSITQSIILGTIQGITEFLPISSSGHLIFIPEIFGWADQGISFDIAVHVGTLVAVLWFCKKTVLNMLMAWTTKYADSSAKAHRQLSLWLIVSALPAILVGAMLGSNSRSILVIAISFIFWGLILGLVDTMDMQHKKSIDDIESSWKEAFILGLFQAIALIPGTSRSGITMIGARARGASHVDATRLSFLMSIPIIAAAGVYQIISNTHQLGDIFSFEIMLGGIVAFVTALVGMHALMALVKKYGFMPFAVYRVVLGCIILFFLA